MASHFARWTLVQSKAQLHRLPLTLMEQASHLPERRRRRYLAARALLAELMLRIYGIPQLPETGLTDGGRPYFINRDLPDFSLAYAGNTVGVLLAEEGCRAGLDMEIVRAHSRQTQEQYFQSFSSSEKAWINAQNDPSEACTQIWTLRQSILKMTGEGNHGVAALRLHPASGRLRSSTLAEIQAICDVETLMVWSCALSPGTERLHLSEYDDDRGWHSLQSINVHSLTMGPRALRLTSLPAEKQHSYS